MLAKIWKWLFHSCDHKWKIIDERNLVFKSANELPYGQIYTLPVFRKKGNKAMSYLKNIVYKIRFFKNSGEFVSQILVDIRQITRTPEDHAKRIAGKDEYWIISKG